VDRCSVAIVIPAFNEESTIGSIVSAVTPYGIPIVTDDASSDRTALFAKQAGAVVVSHDRNLGYDASLESGFGQANQLGVNYAITIDADGQHNPALISTFISALEKGSSVVVGVRPSPARWGEYVFSLYTRLRFGLRDPLSGMKGYDMLIYRKLGHFDCYSSIGTELALYALRSGKTFTEVPIPVRARTDAPRFGNGIRANYRILRSLLFGLIRTSN
jgi:glycosyltransferase involved in cell wall biosynthesis